MPLLPWWTPDVHADRRPFPHRPQPDSGGAARLLRRATISSRSIRATLQVSPGNEAHLHAFADRRLSIMTAAARRSIFTPRRNSPARSCWRPARSASPALPMSIATASAGRCTIRNSPCSNGIGPARTYEALMARLCRDAGSGRRRRSGRSSSAIAARETDPFLEPERITVAEAFERFAGIDLLASIDRDGSNRSRAPGGRDCSASVCVLRTDDHLGRSLQPGDRREGRAQSRLRPRDDPLRISGRRGRPRAADAQDPGWPNGSSSMPAASSSPMPSAN